MPKKILVVGATGKQGSALVSALVSKSELEEPFHVLALTRSTASPNAQALLTQQRVVLVEGDLDSPQTIRKIFEDATSDEGIWGVICVLAFPGLGANADGEERQGKMIADISLEYGVSVFIYSSAERAGPARDDQQRLSGRAKVNIERHIKLLGEKGLPWTILRPGFFMENYDGTIGSITAGVLKSGLNPSTTVQLIAADDAGFVGAAIMRNPAPYKFRELVVTGDVLTMSQQEDAYIRATGRPLPSVWWGFAKFIILINGETKKLLRNIEMNQEVRTSGEHSEWESQVALTRQAHPTTQSFEQWARARAAGSSRKQNWNQVSLWRLLTGKL